MDTDAVIDVGARLVVNLVGRSDEVIFSGNQDAALLHKVGGKASIDDW